MRHWLRGLRCDTPHRRQVLDALNALPALPEADRMRLKPMEIRKPQSITEWDRQHGRRRHTA